ncbi:hypothetical protein ABB37_09112 [Leptomonas pyrrhocoris]|uniref:Uncharacterized protein n=1 Tax=Leptomonas pyrrhocoris TaxID=157538 RepID=A0A0N0DRG1_LEPPY|nr:hypothetical protein ABB37_09112 [Leptomonas pyrrhocoris]KPA74411.1 hypothetical protein ABB37_09112 [Leptomonas pyrrhocoris]|eukprot:XP_015652850.1 hypothetical protein ABB37_09112 [Leptomonas pyrrhocoris]
MGDELSAGTIVGIGFGCIGLVLLVAGGVFLKTVLDHRRRVRRAVNAAAATAAQASRSRYPDAIPCDNYGDLFPNDEPVSGNVIFRSRAEMDRVREVLVRVEDAGDDRSSVDFSTTEMVSMNGSFVNGHPSGQGRPVPHGKTKVGPVLVPSKMGSFDNEHNVSMSFVSAYPTPAPSMPAYGTHLRRGTSASSSFSPGMSGSHMMSVDVPPLAARDGAPPATTATSAHFQDRSRGGLRLLVPAQERTHFSDGHTRPGEQLLTEDDTARKNSKSPLPEEHYGALRNGPEGPLIAAQSYSPPRQPPSPTPHRESASFVDHSSSFQALSDANTASFTHHLAPSFTGQDGTQDGRRASALLRPPALPRILVMEPANSMPIVTGSRSAAAVLSGVRGAARHDPLHVHHAGAPRVKQHKLRIHRQHRVRQVDKGGYVVLEETESSEDENPNETEASPTEEAPPEAGDGGPQQSRPSAPNPAPASTPAAAPSKEKKKRYYFEKLSSLDVYGSARYLPGSTGGYPPMGLEGASSSGSDGEQKLVSAGQMLSATMKHTEAPTYTVNVSGRRT